MSMKPKWPQWPGLAPLSAIAPFPSRRLVLQASAAGLFLAACGPDAALEDGSLPIEMPDPFDRPDDDPEQDVDMPEYNDSLLLSASCEVPSGADGSVNTVALKNPYDLPMHIREIRFRIYPVLQAGDSPSIFRLVTGQALGVKLDMGDIPIVDSQVPVSAFGTIRDASDYTAQTPITSSTSHLPSAAQALRIFTDPAESRSSAPVSYTWRLRYPLYVPPKAVVTPMFTHLGQTPRPIHVDVIYVCNTLPKSYKPPSHVMIPWVGKFLSKAFDNIENTGAAQQASTELNLVNPFAVPLEVARLTGTLALNFNAASSTGALVEDWMEHRNYLGTTKARSSKGDELARKPVPFSGHYPFVWRTWDIPAGWQLGAGDYYRMFLDVGAVDYTTDVYQGRDQYAISLTGYRKVATQGVRVAGVQ